MKNITIRNKRQFTKRLFLFLLGLQIISLGVSLTIISDCGAGAWDALNVGLSETFGLSVGTWVFIVAVVLTLVSSLINKEFPKFSSLVTSIIIGIFIDMWLLIFSHFIFTNLILRLFIFISGIVIISIGVALYIFTNFPIGPMDYFMVVLKNKLNTNFTISKTIAEVIGLILSLIVGGPIGIGTFIILFTIGPTIDFFSKVMTPKLNKIINM